MKYLFDCKILRKSINDTDDIESVDCADSLKDSSQLYLSARGYELWKMAGTDSVYMELCREDFYRDYNDKGNCPKCTFDLLTEGRQELIFIDLFNMLLELLHEEKLFLQYSFEHGTLDIYEKKFSRKIIFDQFYKGICKSIDYSGYLQYDKVKDAQIMVEDELNKLKHAYFNN